ncbi:alpha-glucosidase [Georgenia sp. Z1344]|uniref:alpha-glucosidase n=1 Tax=Georgenia sp. Z1344 TaxID=3416706 RepID=UPI003CF966AA
MTSSDAGRRRGRRRPRRWRRITLVVALVLVVGVTAGILWRLPPPATDLADPPTGDLDAGDGGTWEVGGFDVVVGDSLTVTHDDADGPVWETAPGDAFLTAAAGETTYRDDVGLLRIDDEHDATWAAQTIDSVEPDGDTLRLTGTLTGDDGDLGPVGWEMALSEGAPGRLDVDVRIAAEGAAGESGDGEADGRAPNRLYLSSVLAEDESVHGLGAQSGDFDLRGRRVPIVSREQGVGRGNQPLSFAVDLAEAAAGGQDTTYLVSGVNVTSEARSLAYRGERIASVDLTGEGLVWEVWADEASFSLAAAGTPLEAVEIQSGWAGAADPPPSWTQEGAIVGLQGGTDEVRAELETLRNAGVPVAAVWLQDWTGRRVTSFGDRLQWNWVLDEERYPGWDELVAELEAEGIRVLTYTNAFVTADSGAAAAERGGRDLHAEAAELGHLVLDPAGEVYELDQQGFDAAMVDLTSEDAREWFARVIADEVADAGASGWMADFAEGPPPDAVLDAGSGEQWRAAWPVLWQEVNARALELAGLESEGLVWHRSGHSASAGAADALWLGDQMQDWSAEDGLASVPAMLQATAASGMAQMHSDVGGYTSLALPVVPDIGRDDELLARWGELSVLGPVLRTHEGNRPAEVVQAAGSAETAADLAASARLFVALAPERARLTEDDPLGAAQHHPWMIHGGAELLEGAGAEIAMGPDVLLTPVLEPGAESVEAVLPPGRWVHAWSGGVHGEDDGVTEVEVDAPIGRPALFVREGTQVADEITAFVADERSSS